ncbi:hypothetical protein [Sulfurivirga sp.]|uniref:hypothetical protein n=1 Tax=Sulfurivirga sp. TaxID=2614236 RepID=UPI0025FBEFEC|nr:hypothetical protein [Sulfurivirga sp.]
MRGAIRKLRIQITNLGAEQGRQRYLVRSSIKPSVHLALDAVMDTFLPESLISDDEYNAICERAEMTPPVRTGDRHWRWAIKVSLPLVIREDVA